MSAAIVRHEIAHDGDQPFKVTYFSGNSSQTVPLVVDKMKDVELRYAGLGGTNVGNKKYDAKNYSDGDVSVRVNDHKGAESTSFNKSKRFSSSTTMTKQSSANGQTNFATNTCSAAPSASSLTTVWPWSVRAYRQAHSQMSIRTGLM